jgi:hypothetical protein
MFVVEGDGRGYEKGENDANEIKQVTQCELSIIDSTES